MIGRILALPLTRLLVIALVPAVVLGVFVAALAAADAGKATIPAALVNQDRLVQSRGADGKTTTVAAGRLVVTALTKPASPSTGATVDWTLTDADEAADMLAAGDVYAVVTIPCDFSKSISTVSGTDPQRADIRVTTDDTHGTLVSQIGGIVGDTVASTVGGRITSQVVSGLYGGFATLRTSLTKAADGAEGIGDGVASLSSGLSETADGEDGIADGASGLGDGARQLAGGADRLSTGLGTAATGAQTAATGARSFARGVDTYTDGVTQYTRGVNGLLDGVTPVLDGAVKATGKVSPSEVATAASQAAAKLRDASTTKGLDPKAAAGLRTLAGKLDAVRDGSSELAGAVSQLKTARSGLARLRKAGTQLQQGGDRLDSGASSLARGLGRLPGGIRSAAGGAAALGTGATRLGSGADGLATGAAKLATGIRKSASGATRLAKGADSLGSGLRTGVKQVPNLTAAERARAADVITNPVSATSTRRNELSGPGEIVATLILPVGLWIGAAALVLLFGAVRRRLLATGVGTGRLVGGALAQGAVVALGQAVLAVVLLAITLRPSWGALPLLGLVAVVAAVAFLAIHQLLQAVFGRAGTVLSIVLLGVQLVAVGGIYPIELVSAPFQAISPFLPLTAAVQAVTTILGGAPLGAVASGIALLVLEGLLAFLVTVVVVGRRRTSTALFSPVPALP